MSRRILILAGITGALAALSALDPTPPVAPIIELTLPALDALDAIEVHQPPDAPIRLERRGAAWFVGDAPVDRHVQQQLGEVFQAPIPMDARVDDPDPSRYGLTDRTLTVTLGATTIRVGKVVDGRQTFIRTADGAIYRARANLRSVLDRPAHTWPERRIFSGTAADVGALALEQAGRARWAVRREGDGWAIAEGRGAVDVEQAEGLAHMLATLRAERFVKPTPFTPALTVKLRLGDADEVLEIGPLDGLTAPARVVGRDTAFLIAKSVVQLLDIPREALVDRRIYVGDPAAVTAMVIGQARIAPDSPKWRGELLALRALSLPDSAPADAFAKVEVGLEVFAGEQRWALELGAAYGQGARFARTSDGRVLILGPATLRELTPPVLDER